MKARSLYNPLVTWLLRSPLHPVMSKSVLLLTFQGRRSGRTFTTPVSYARDGENLLLVSNRDHSWWKNLRGGVKVTLRIRGRDKEGVAEVYEGEAAEEGLLMVMLAGPFLGLGLPLLPLQILWINLITDGPPALALSAEPAERGIMRRPPHPPGEGIFGRGLGRHVMWVGTLMALVSLVAGLWYSQAAPAIWQTMVFTTLTLSQLSHVVAIRSGEESLFRVGLLSNKPFLLAVVLTFGLQLLAIYAPFLQRFLETEALPLAHLAVAVALGSIIFWAVEFEKLLARRRDPYKGPQSEGSVR